MALGGKPQGLGFLPGEMWMVLVRQKCWVMGLCCVRPVIVADCTEGPPGLYSLWLSR